MQRLYSAGERLLIFDFDGVLGVKTNSEYPVELFSPFIKRGRRLPTETMFTFRGTDWIFELEKLGIDVADQGILAAISRNMIDYCQGLDESLFDWTHSVIPELAEAKQLAILSNNTMKNVMRRLGALAKHFYPILTWENVPKLKPAPDGILSICKSSGIASSETLMIGDSEEDLSAARAAGVKSLFFKGESAKLCSSLELVGYDFQNR